METLFIAQNEAGELLPMDQCIEVRDCLADLARGDHPGRESDDEITNFVSLGIAVEEIAAGDLVHSNAVEGGGGIGIEFGGARDG